MHTIARLQARFETEAGAMFEVSSEETYAIWVGEIRLRWDIVHNEVRPRATDAGLNWFTAAQIVEAGRVMSPLYTGLPRWCADQRNGLRWVGQGGMGSDRLRHASTSAQGWLNNFRARLSFLNDVESYRVLHDDALTNGL